MSRNAAPEDLLVRARRQQLDDDEERRLELKRLFLHGYDPQSEVAVPFLLLDLSDPEQPQSTTLDIPLNWAESGWSSDGTYVSFIGGSPTLDARPLLVVDATAATVPPRTILTCNSNPAPLPGCPNRAVFQP